MVCVNCGLEHLSLGENAKVMKQAVLMTFSYKMAQIYQIWS